MNMNKKEVSRKLPRFDLFPKNQRGQGLSTSAIILIILGVIVLVILALGFILGWDNIAPWISGGDNNVDVVSQACQLACTTQSEYDFCSRLMKLEATDLPNVDEKTVKSVEGTCYFFSTDPGYEKYRIDTCPSITC